MYPGQCYYVNEGLKLNVLTFLSPNVYEVPPLCSTVLIYVVTEGLYTGQKECGSQKLLIAEYVFLTKIKSCF